MKISQIIDEPLRPTTLTSNLPRVCNAVTIIRVMIKKHFPRTANQLDIEAGHDIRKLRRKGPKEKHLNIVKPVSDEGHSGRCGNCVSKVKR